MSLQPSEECLTRVRSERLLKIQRELAAEGIDGLLLTDPINMRYATGLSMMPLWLATTNFARYTLIPATGTPVLFEYPEGQFLAKQHFSDVRPVRYWQSRFVGDRARNEANTWAAEIADALKERVSGMNLGIDRLDHYGFLALSEAGFSLRDADAPLQRARVIKTKDEITLLSHSLDVTETALKEFENSIKPGVSEHDLLAAFWAGILKQGGEWCYTRLISSGSRTNPWFQEASTRTVSEGELVGIDTDTIGPEGYACDISRTFLCGDGKLTTPQRDAFTVARDFIEGAIGEFKPGRSFAEITDSLPRIPTQYLAQRYPIFAHGIGMDDEPPFLPFPDQTTSAATEGTCLPGMVLCVECYAGVENGKDGVKLEEQIQITDSGPVKMSRYPLAPLL